MKGLNSSDKAVSDGAAKLADLYLQDPNREIDENSLKIKTSRTTVNQEAFDNMGKTEQSSLPPGNTYY